MGEGYINSALCGAISTRAQIGDYYYLTTFASTNKAQATAFADALAVMAEMRMQEGITIPDGTIDYWTISGDEHCLLAFDSWTRMKGMSLFPAYVSETAACNAVETVGEQRVIDCIKTMNFMTPESRGEI